jgi:uncharacterized protein YbaR (Trm112 family)
MAEHRTLNVACPCCKAALVVDAENGDVLLHKEARTAPELDIVKAAQALKGEPKRRDEIFRKALEAEKRKGSRLEKQFEEGLKRAKDDPASPPPLREIDLD